MTTLQLRRALAQHRLERGFSFEKLAGEIGVDRVTRVTVMRFIDGIGEPQELTIYAIAQYLKTQGVAA